MRATDTPTEQFPAMMRVIRRFLLALIMAVTACEREEAALIAPPGESKHGAAILSFPTITNSIHMRLAWISPGEFLMGSPLSEPARDEDEALHRVRLSRGFHIGVTEVTQAQWRAVMNNDPSKFVGDHLPVDSVSWFDAHEFCRRLSQMESRPYRLPTEAEWEYACRAGTITMYSCSDDQASLKAVAWCSDNSDWRTHRVAQVRPNPWGLFDVHGNVWEWCADWYAPYLIEDVCDPRGPASGDLRVLRGGSWDCSALQCRSAQRLASAPHYKGVDGGFRVVTDAP